MVRDNKVEQGKQETVKKIDFTQPSLIKFVPTVESSTNCLLEKNSRILRIDNIG